MTWRKAMGLLGLTMALGCALNVVLFAQESALPVGVPAPAPAPELLDSQSKWIVMQFGFAGMLLVVFFYVWKRLIPIEDLVKKYDEAQQAHLAAFREINERNLTSFVKAMDGMQKSADDAQSTAILCAQVNTRVAERLEYLGKALEKERHA